MGMFRDDFDTLLKRTSECFHFYNKGQDTVKEFFFFSRGQAWVKA